MVRVILTGGIGNQLFKALGAIGRAGVQIENLTFDVSWFQRENFSSSVTATRSFELDNFPAFSSVPKKILKHSYALRESRMINKSPSLMRLLGYWTPSGPPINAHRFPRVIKSDFEDFLCLPSPSQLRELLKFAEPSSGWLRDMKSHALTESPIAVHVRRADYLGFAKIYPRLGVDYYREAIHSMTQKLGLRPLWLFSDEPKLVLDEFHGEIHFDRVITPPDSTSSVEILELFAEMSGVIVANSTFSWWGSYIGTIQGKVQHVILPEVFTYLENDPGAKLQVPGWQTLPIGLGGFNK
jgi:hypothetical protein